MKKINIATSVCDIDKRYPVKRLKFAVSNFRGLMKMTYWRILILAFMIYHRSKFKKKDENL